MFPITSYVTCVRAAPGVYRLYYQIRWVGHAVTIDNDALYVSHPFTESGPRLCVTPRRGPLARVDRGRRRRTSRCRLICNYEQETA
jgi:hypothetical protein